MVSRLVLLSLLALGLSGCALYRPSAGNPNGDAYVGGSDSTYEARANPPQTIGQVAYNPSAPLPESVEPSVPSGAALSMPTTPPPPPPSPMPRR